MWTSYHYEVLESIMNTGKPPVGDWAKACLRDLIEEGYCSSRKLTLKGGTEFEKKKAAKETEGYSI